ncbi:hypothetical protein MBANPS3_007991 [Mucor bainieri]
MPRTPSTSTRTRTSTHHTTHHFHVDVPSPQTNSYNERLLQIELRAAHEKILVYQAMFSAPIQGGQQLAQPSAQQASSQATHQEMARLEGLILQQQREIALLKGRLHAAESEVEFKLHRLEQELEEKYKELDDNIGCVWDHVYRLEDYNAGIPGHVLDQMEDEEAAFEAMIAMDQMNLNQ